MEKKENDHTINGECSGCGKCCTNILPVSQIEINRIKKYCNKNNIKPINHCNIMTNEYSNVCPFLNKNNRCNIYQVRPEICRHFICSKFKNNYDYFNYDDKIIINMLNTFSPNSFQPKAPNVKKINENFQQKKKQLK